jgi:hypothetical protein
MKKFIYAALVGLCFGGVAMAADTAASQVTLEIVDADGVASSYSMSVRDGVTVPMSHTTHHSYTKTCESGVGGIVALTPATFDTGLAASVKVMPTGADEAKTLELGMTAVDLISTNQQESSNGCVIELPETRVANSQSTLFIKRGEKIEYFGALTGKRVFVSLR